VPTQHPQSGVAGGGTESVPQDGEQSYVLFRAGSRLCAFPVGTVVEVMRLQPIEPAPGASAVVRGISVIRGLATPVLDLQLLLDGTPGETATRMLTVRTDRGTVALCVDAMLGVRRFKQSEFAATPPLLAGAQRELMDALAVLDDQLLLVLRSARLVPDLDWRSLPEAVAGDA
jgi:purine-binding chemotaxis protein CheW